MAMTPLTSEQALLTINDLVTQLVAKEAEIAQRRVDQRYALNAAVMICAQPKNGGQPKPLFPAWALDLSYQGAGLICEQQILPGKSVAIQMTNAHNQPFLVNSRVMYCRSLIGSICRMGVMFLFDD